MTTADLIIHLCAHTGWNITRVNQEAGVSARTSSAKRNGSDNTEGEAPACPPKDSFDLKVLRAACRLGATAPALAVLFDTAPVPITLIAPAMYPDLSLGEFSAIADVRRLSPDLALTNEAIRAIVERRRREVAASTFPGS